MRRRILWSGVTGLTLALLQIVPALATGPPTFDLTKIVKAPGATGSQCAVVVAGQKVDYCYRVDNNSGISTFTNLMIVDDQLGTIVPPPVIMIPPFGTVTPVKTGVMINADITNVATATALSWYITFHRYQLGPGRRRAADHAREDDRYGRRLHRRLEHGDGRRLPAGKRHLLLQGHQPAPIRPRRSA